MSLSVQLIVALTFLYLAFWADALSLQMAATISSAKGGGSSAQVKIGSIRKSTTPVPTSGVTVSAKAVTFSQPVAIKKVAKAPEVVVSAAKVTVSAVNSKKSAVKVTSSSGSFDLDRTIDVLLENKVLTQLARLGLLSRLERAGIKLTTLAPLLRLVDELDALSLLEQNADKLLPLVQKGVELTPSLLPLASKALSVPPATLSNAALLAFLAGVGEVLLIPDTSVTSVALQTALFVPLGIILPGALIAGSAVLNKLK